MKERTDNLRCYYLNTSSDHSDIVADYLPYVWHHIVADFQNALQKQLFKRVATSLRQPKRVKGKYSYIFPFENFLR